MTPDVIAAQVESLRAWAQMWMLAETSGSEEVAFLMNRAAKIMETGQVPPGEADAPSSFPAPTVQSDVSPEPPED